VGTQRAAELQVVLEGVALPATKAELLDYARTQDVDAARKLQSLPDGEYRSLDEVGEALEPVQPPAAEARSDVPREESDAPPGGDSYVDPSPEPGAVRHDAPPWNPPEKALEEQTKTQQEQKRRQDEELPG
jgi:Protein of unknown function (DUF2795)